MGKGFNNFMSKKAFHPGSYANQKRIQEAEAKAEAKRKHDEETLEQYRKEQELFQQRSLVSKQSKEKLSLSFMYDAPPGTSQKNESTTTSDTLIPKLEKKQKPQRSQSSSDEEEELELTWQRQEPKAKKAAQQISCDKNKTVPKQETKRIKIER